MRVRQSIPLPEEKKTLSHVVTRTTAAAGVAAGGRSSRRRKVRVPELPSNKFLEEDEEEDNHLNNTANNTESPRRPPFGRYVFLDNATWVILSFFTGVCGNNRMNYSFYKTHISMD